MMTSTKTVLAVMTALTVSAPALAHHEATFTATSHGPSALVIGAVVVGVATLATLAVKAIRNRA